MFVTNDTVSTVGYKKVNFYSGCSGLERRGNGVTTPLSRFALK